MHRKWHSRSPSSPAPSPSLTPSPSFPAETETHYELHEGAQEVQVGGVSWPSPPSLRFSFQFRVFGTTKRQIREKLKEKGYDATLQHERKIAILLYFNNALRYVIPTRNSAGAPARASSSTISIPFSIWTRSLSMSLRVAIAVAVAVAVWGLSTNSRLAMQPKSSFTHSQSYFVCGQVINSFRSLHALGLFIRQHCLLEFV